MLLIERIIGNRLDPALSARIHDLEHRNAIDLLVISPEDAARHRFRARTSRGTDLAIALPRDEHLFDGAILLLDEDRAVAVRFDEQRWLRLQPLALGDALELGYHVGNLHWRVRFEAEALLVALEGPVEEYLQRLEGLMANLRVKHTVVLHPGSLP